MKIPFYILSVVYLFISVSVKADRIADTDSLGTKSEADSTSGPKKLTWSAHVMGFGRSTGFVNYRGSLNPENRVAQIKKWDMGLYLRPEIKYENNKIGVWIKPRLNIDVDAESLSKKDSYEYDFFFQQLKGKWQVTNSFSVMGGRYIKAMGTSIFLNPSNPFFINPGRLNPKIEISPMDFVELNYSTESNWNFSLIANLYDADNFIYNKPFFEFKRTYGLLTEYFGDSENLGAIFSVDESNKYHLGGYGQKSLDNAVIVWTDFSVNYNINRFYPVNGHYTHLLNYEMVNGDKNENFFFTGLAGASYTFNFGPTLQVEYLYNGKGYSKKESEMYYSMVESSVNYNFDVTERLSDLNLGRGINTGMPFIRKNYLFTQLGEPDLFGSVNCNLRYLYSIDDKSSQFSSLIEWDAKDNLEAYLVFLKNYGGRKTDLHRLIDHQLMVGLIYKL